MLEVTQIAVFLDVAAQALRAALLLHDRRMQWRERDRMRHLQSVTVIAKRLLVADRAVLAIGHRLNGMRAHEVRTVRQRYPMTPNTVVVRVTRGARLQHAHPVSLFPVGPVGDGP